MGWTITRTPPYDGAGTDTKIGPNGRANTISADLATGKLRLDTTLMVPRRQNVRQETASAYASVAVWLDPPPGQTMSVEANFGIDLVFMRNHAEDSVVSSKGMTGLFGLELDGIEMLTARDSRRNILRAESEIAELYLSKETFAARTVELINSMW